MFPYFSFVNIWGLEEIKMEGLFFLIENISL